MIMVPLLGMQIVSGLVAGATIFSAEYALGFAELSLLASYVIFALAVGIAQLRKAIF